MVPNFQGCDASCRWPNLKGWPTVPSAVQVCFDVDASKTQLTFKSKVETCNGNFKPCTMTYVLSGPTRDYSRSGKQISLACH